MNTTSRAAMAAAALTLSVSPIVLAGPAVADGGGKAAIELAERQAAGSGGLTTKAQIEQRERQSTSPGGMTRAQLEARWRAQAESGGDFTGGGARQQPSPSVPSGDGGAAAWQLALSAALGAVMVGGVLVAVRQVGQHRHPVASAH